MVVSRKLCRLLLCAFYHLLLTLFWLSCIYLMFRESLIFNFIKSLKDSSQTYHKPFLSLRKCSSNAKTFTWSLLLLSFLNPAFIYHILPSFTNLSNRNLCKEFVNDTKDTNTAIFFIVLFFSWYQMSGRTSRAAWL